jgi:hypothetical protein
MAEKGCKMSSPKVVQNLKLRQVKLKSGRLVVAEKLAEQHYLIWANGTPLTEG